MRSTTRWAGRLAATGMAAVSVLAVSGCNGTPTVSAPTSTITTAPPGPPAFTTLATLHSSVPKYSAPGSASDGTVPGSWYGYTSVLPVIATQPGWLDVRLAQRPNESTAWIKSSGVALSLDPYRMVLTLSTRHLQVYDDNRQIGEYPAGIGTTTDPTVTGNYFVALKAPSLGPGYGAFELGTSAHSDAIQDFDGFSDAIIAIHGPITAEDNTLIGTTGAQISHGCIRLHYSALNQLASVPVGTTLKIVA